MLSNWQIEHKRDKGHTWWDEDDHVEQGDDGGRLEDPEPEEDELCEMCGYAEIEEGVCMVCGWTQSEGHEQVKG